MLIKHIVPLILLVITPEFLNINNISDKNFFFERNISYSILYIRIVEQQIKFPEIVLAQAILESGHFKSPVFVENNNLFGMKHPERRTTLSKKIKNSNYAYYNSWSDSVSDYKLWQESVMGDNICSDKDYLMLLSRIYAEDKNYINKLSVIINNI